MDTEKKPLTWQTIAGLSGLMIIIVLALVVPNSGLFQADFSQQLHSASSGCQKIDAIVLPGNPIPANTPAAIAISTTPDSFTGPFTYSASSGNFNDGQGNIGSYIQTSNKKVNYSGGEDGTTVTIQAQGNNNSNCVVTIPVIQPSTVACTSLKVVSDPSPLPPNQSAALTIIPTPSNFQGTYIFEADSGSFQMQDADVQA